MRIFDDHYLHFKMRRRKEDESSSVKSLNDVGKPTRNSIPLENGHLVIILVTFRTINALLSFSSFVPDEYWQTLEVAHRMTFGYPNNNVCKFNAIQKLIQGLARGGEGEEMGWEEMMNEALLE